MKKRRSARDLNSKCFSPLLVWLSVCLFAATSNRSCAPGGKSTDSHGTRVTPPQMHTQRQTKTLPFPLHFFFIYFFPYSHVFLNLRFTKLSTIKILYFKYKKFWSTKMIYFTSESSQNELTTHLSLIVVTKIYLKEKQYLPFKFNYRKLSKGLIWSVKTIINLNFINS